MRLTQRSPRITFALCVVSTLVLSYSALYAATPARIVSVVEKADRGNAPTSHFFRLVQDEQATEGDGGEITSLLRPPPEEPDEQEHRNSGFIDLNVYWDTREATVMTINSGATLPYDLEYFQFTNYFSPTGSNSGDWTGFYTEVHLRKPIAKEHRFLKPFDMTLQYADGTFPQNVLRVGVRWRLQDTPGPFGKFVTDVLKLQYTLNLHVMETDGTGWQIEHAYRRGFFDNRVYIAGFADHNVDNGSRNSTWVTEHQIGLKLFDEWHAVAEYRYNSFEPNPFKRGWGLGLEYVIRFKYE